MPVSLPTPIRRWLARVGLDRRWISDASERVIHEGVVRHRLSEHDDGEATAEPASPGAEKPPAR